MIVRGNESAVVIAHDYLTQRGGAERVVSALCQAFPKAPVVTSLFDPAGTFGEFAEVDVQTTGLQRIPLLAKHHRFGLPGYAAAFGKVIIDSPLTICSTSGWAHGVRTTGAKALYVHNTARWIYQPDEYLGGRLSPAKAITAPFQKPLRSWDLRAATAADKVWVNSKVVQERVWNHWCIDSEVLYPPHAADVRGSQEAVEGLEPGYLLAVARLLHYKRVDVLVEAMRELPRHRLVVVGEGPEGRRLRSRAPSNCRFLGQVSDQRLRWLYANCSGLVSAAHEDLGLTPLEAMAFGRPVAVLRRGGFIETIREGETGIFFDEPTPGEVASAIRVLVTSRWQNDQIASWAERFSLDAFKSRIRSGARELVRELELSAQGL